MRPPSRTRRCSRGRGKSVCHCACKKVFKSGKTSVTRARMAAVITCLARSCRNEKRIEMREVVEMRKSVFVLTCLTYCIWAQEGTGPLPAVMEQDTGLPTHTVYRPKELSSLAGQKLPIVAWGEGGCSNNGAFYKNFLGEIAAHGFLIVAVGQPQQPQPPANPGAPPA